MNDFRLTLARLSIVLAALSACLFASEGRVQAEDAPGWVVEKTIELEGLKVSLSRPVLVARSKGYLWFPTLTRLADGGLVALMSNYADIHTKKATATVAWSDDGGLTWSEPASELYGDASLTLPAGDQVFLPYYLFPREGGALGAPYQVCERGQRKMKTIEEGLSVSGWPRKDKSYSPELGLAGFVFNGQTMTLKDGVYLATLYGTFEGASRYSLVAAESADGRDWKIRSVIADENCKLTGGEGPCEAALCRMADGRLLCVYRMASFVPFGQSFSSDDGRTWTEPVAMDGPFSVQPSLAVMQGGTLALSGGRPGISLWLNADGAARKWAAVDLMEHHNACHSQETIDAKKMTTSSYTEVVAMDETHALCIYDRIPNSWHAIAEDSTDTNSVWVVQVTIERK